MRLLSFQSYTLALCLVLLLAFVTPALSNEIQGIKSGASSYKHWGPPEFLVDGELATAWVGGRKGVGPGKWLSFEFPGPRKVRMINVANGNQGEGKFSEFRCITSGILLLPDHGAYLFSLKPEAGEQSIVFPPAKVKSFQIIITEVHPAPGHSGEGEVKVAVSEVRVFSEAPAGAMDTVTSISSAAAQAIKPRRIAPQKSGKISFFSATKPGVVYIRASMPGPDTPLKEGVVDPLAGREIVGLIHRYFNDLITLKDEYLGVFASSIRLRELEAFHVLQEELRRKNKFDAHLAATVDASGLSIDKPIVRGDSAIARTHGVYRYFIQGKQFDFPVDAFFSFTKTNGAWLINGVKEQ